MESDQSLALDSILFAETLDVYSLRALSRLPGGYLNTGYRSRIWPVLCGIRSDNDIKFKDVIVPHKDEKQVECDIERYLYLEN